MPHRKPVAGRSRERGWALKEPGGAQQSRKRPTINDIARLANVSKKTVSRVINEEAFVREETRLRVNAAIRQSGFVPDPQARALAFRRSFLVGAICEDPGAQRAALFEKGILEGLQGTGYELVLRRCDRASAGFLDDIASFVDRQKLSGLIVLPPLSEDSRLANSDDRIGCPVLRIVAASAAPSKGVLVMHDHEGAVLAAEHLAALGHVSIAQIAGPTGAAWARDRRRGFASGLSARGLRLGRRYEREADGTFEGGRAAARALLAPDHRPTAIFACNDEMAAGAYAAAREVGLSIPGDLSIVGFGDDPIAAHLLPPLTTVGTPLIELGRLAAQTLMPASAGQARREEGAGPMPSLAVRDSTAAPPGRTGTAAQVKGA